MKVKCFYDDHLIESDSPSTYQRVHGWERKRSGGGLNVLTLREPEQTWACEQHVNEHKRGLAGQLGFVEMWAD